jgi:integrase
MKDSRIAKWVVERVDVNGEELPIIRDAETWEPAPIALRYVLKLRFRLGPGALASDMRAIAHTYNCTECDETIGDFDGFILNGGCLSRNQLLQLSSYLHRQHFICESGGANGLVCNLTFNSRLFAFKQYYQWAIEPANHGGTEILDEDARDSAVSKMKRVLGNERFPTGASKRREPLMIAAIKLIRKAIGPDELGHFPENVFSEETRLRNWVMFEMDLGLGERISELLTTRVEHIPLNAVDSQFFVPRQQDANDDPRKRRRPRGKTNERFVPIMDPSILPWILLYRDSPPPVGRSDPNFSTPFFFVTEDGQPISISTANYIIKKIGEYTIRLLESDTTIDQYTRERLKKTFLNLTWHSLRHTWAEFAALALYKKYGEGAWAILKNWGGWNAQSSMERYIQYTRQAICEEATRNYQASRFTK